MQSLAYDDIHAQDSMFGDESTQAGRRQSTERDFKALEKKKHPDIIKRLA
jgi:hypothetical protein